MLNPTPGGSVFLAREQFAWHQVPSPRGTASHQDNRASWARAAGVGGLGPEGHTWAGESSTAKKPALQVACSRLGPAIWSTRPTKTAVKPGIDVSLQTRHRSAAFSSDLPLLKHFGYCWVVYTFSNKRLSCFTSYIICLLIKISRLISSSKAHNLNMNNEKCFQKHKPRNAF